MTALRPPLIGISTYLERTQFGAWDVPAAVLPYAYVRAVQAAGGRAVLLPPEDGVADAVEVLDALVLAGGSDVDPAAYGAPPHPAVTETRPDRDKAEFALVAAARARDLPLLGICRGMQVMAVEAGGSLIPHLPDVVGDARHRPSLGHYACHGARYAPGSLAHRILGDAGEVTSSHHQAVADPGWLTVTGWADDGTAEALEEPGRRFALGVQGHPEASDDARLFEALVAAARGRD